MNVKSNVKAGQSLGRRSSTDGLHGERGAKQICERRKDMKIKSNVKAGQSTVAVLD